MEDCLGRSNMKAFEDARYDYYILTQSLGGGVLPAGAIFYHDKFDNVRGSIAQGCLKLCWTPEGHCYGGLCGDTVVFHTNFIHTDLFQLAHKGAGFDTERLDELEDELEKAQKIVDGIKKEIDELLGK